MLEFVVDDEANVPTFKKRLPSRAERNASMTIKGVFQNEGYFVVNYSNGMSAEFGGFPYALLYV